MFNILKYHVICGRTSVTVSHNVPFIILSRVVCIGKFVEPHFRDQYVMLFLLEGVRFLYDHPRGCDF